MGFFFINERSKKPSRYGASLKGLKGRKRSRLRVFLKGRDVEYEGALEKAREQGVEKLFPGAAADVGGYSRHPELKLKGGSYRGNTLEAKFLDCCDLLGLPYESNEPHERTDKEKERGDKRRLGAVWDFRPVGPGWHNLIDEEECNIKILHTTWMFGSSRCTVSVRNAVMNYQNGVYGERGSESAKKRAASALRRMLIADLTYDGLHKTVFFKPKSKKIHNAIIKAANNMDIKAAYELLHTQNFYAKKMGRFHIDVGELVKRIHWEGEDCEKKSYPASQYAKTWAAKSVIHITGGVGVEMIVHGDMSGLSNLPERRFYFNDVSGKRRGYGKLHSPRTSDETDKEEVAVAALGKKKTPSRKAPKDDDSWKGLLNRPEPRLPLGYVRGGTDEARRVCWKRILED